MSVPAAYLGVILIWATTPLAIKWSGEGGAFLFGLAGRMVIGLVACLLVVALLSLRMTWHRRARHVYLVAGLGIWGAMTSVYWAAQFIPSGLISVVFGLTPIITGLFAALVLQERALTPYRLLGMVLGVLGLGVIFGRTAQLGPEVAAGVTGVLLSVLVHSLSSVWVKRLGAAMHPLELTTGALLVAAPLFLATWWLADGDWPAQLSRRTGVAILYLAVFGSVIGFVLFYYLLRHSAASRVALITLVTPVLALLLGQSLNAETVGVEVWLGTLIILAGLASHQWGDDWLARRSRRSA